MSNPSQRKGTAWATSIVGYLQSWWPHAERRAPSGSADRGDIAGLVGVCIEAKAMTRWAVPCWLAELDAEIKNSGADTGAVWAKQRGKARAADGVILMRPAVYVALLKEAGY